MIREAKREDLPELFDMVVALEREVRFIQPDRTCFVRNWTNLIATGTAVIFLEYDKKISGLFAGLIMPEINSGVNLAVESLWYVVPENRHNGVGKRLLNRFEQWAKEKNVKHIATAKPFRRLKLNGYRSIETFLMKEI
jgi:N-acetylglutamate synthase-like GNAT family acetyltransferase